MAGRTAPAAGMTRAARGPIRAPVGLAAALLCSLFPSACTSDAGLLPGSDDTQSAPDTDTTPTDSGSADFDLYREMPPCGPAEVWCPGDPIPGWPSLTPDLSVLDGKEVVEWELPKAFGWVMKTSHCPDSEPDCAFKYGYLWGELDFVELGAASSSEPMVWLRVRPGDVDRVLGLGWYENVCTIPYPHGDPWVNTSYRGGDDQPNYETGGADCYKDFGYIHADTRAFLSDVRPDRFRGLVYFDLTTNPDVEDPVVYLLNFEIRFPIHGGEVAYSTPGVPPFRAIYNYIGDENGYDNAWPWDYITDPAIRDRVYELYMPYGMVWPEERRRRPE